MLPKKGSDSEVPVETSSPWTLYTKSVCRIDTKKKNVIARPIAKSTTIRTEKDALPPLFWHDSLRESAEWEINRGLARSRKMKEIDATLDLHGLSQKQAFSRLCHFIEGAIKRDHRTIRVITGKGRKIGEECSFSILQQILPLWCREQPLSLWVIKIERARPHDGGDGAYYLFLRQLKRLYA